MDTNARDSTAKVVIGAAYEVSSALGAGFLEKVYERALAEELLSRGLAVKSQADYAVFYKGRCVGQYFADIVVDNEVLVELKCVEQFSSEHLAQCINYLKVSGLKLALLLNFRRPKLEWKRVVYG